MMNEDRKMLHLSAKIDVLSSVFNDFFCELMDIFVGKHIFQYCLSVFCGIDLNFIKKKYRFF